MTINYLNFRLAKCTEKLYISKTYEILVLTLFDKIIEDTKNIQNNQSEFHIQIIY